MPAAVGFSRWSLVSASARVMATIGAIAAPTAFCAVEAGMCARATSPARAGTGTFAPRLGEGEPGRTLTARLSQKPARAWLRSCERACLCARAVVGRRGGERLQAGEPGSDGSVRERVPGDVAIMT